MRQTQVHSDLQNPQRMAFAQLTFPAAPITIAVLGPKRKHKQLFREPDSKDANPASTQNDLGGKKKKGLGGGEERTRELKSSGSPPATDNIFSFMKYNSRFEKQNLGN